MTNDKSFPERFEFHDWHLEKFGTEFPYTYSDIAKILTLQTNIEEFKKVSPLVKEYYKDKGLVFNRNY